MNGDFPRRSWALAAVALAAVIAAAVGFTSYQAGVAHVLALHSE